QELVAKYDHYRRGDQADAQAMQAVYRLALLCCDESRWEDAERWTEYGRDVPVPEHFLSWAVLGLAARSRVAAHPGHLEPAPELGRRGAKLAERSHETNLRASPWLVLGEVHRKRCETEEADGAVVAALRLYEAKGNVAAAGRVRATFGLPVLGGSET